MTLSHRFFNWIDPNTLEQLEDDDELFNIPTSPTLAKQSPVRGPTTSFPVTINSCKIELPLNTKSQVVHTKDLQLVDDDTDLVNLCYEYWKVTVPHIQEVWISKNFKATLAFPGLPCLPTITSNSESIIFHVESVLRDLSSLKIILNKVLLLKGGFLFTIFMHIMCFLNVDITTILDLITAST